MQPLMNGAQNTASTLQQCDGRTDRHLLIGVRHAKISRSNKLLRRRHAEPQQLHKGRARLLIRKRHQVVAKRPARSIHIAPLARLDRVFRILNAHPLGLEASRNVHQGPRINQLSEDRGR